MSQNPGTRMVTRMVPQNRWSMDVYSPKFGNSRFWRISISMDIYGYQWIVYGYQWISMDGICTIPKWLHQGYSISSISIRALALGSLPHPPRRRVFLHRRRCSPPLPLKCSRVPHKPGPRDHRWRSMCSFKMLEVIIIRLVLFWGVASGKFWQSNMACHGIPQLYDWPIWKHPVSGFPSRESHVWSPRSSMSWSQAGFKRLQWPHHGAKNLMKTRLPAVISSAAPAVSQVYVALTHMQ